MAKLKSKKTNIKKEYKEPAISQWETLYEAARQIRKIEPWNYLWDAYLITVNLPQIQDPVYCSVMGKNGSCYAIGLYYDKESIASFNSIMEYYSEDEPYCISAYDQKCLMCYFGNKEELLPKDKDVLKKLNISFRGKNEWIYFRSLNPGCAPWYINSEQADILIRTLQILIKACAYIEKEKPEIDFENKETLACAYAHDKKDLLFKKELLPIDNFHLSCLEFDNDELFSKLKEQKRNLINLEFEIAYIPLPVQENKNARPFFPRIILLMDRKNGVILDQYMANKDDGCEMAVLEIISKYILENGRPAAIYVRDYRTGRYIEDFCNKADIKLVMDEDIPAIDNFLYEMLSNFG